MAERRRIALPENGVEIGILDFGGDGPTALLHHANGFCAAVWGPVAQALTRHYRVIAMDARGHGRSSRPEGAQAYAWGWFGRDVIGVADVLRKQHGVETLALGLGHSFGGTAMISASAKRPELFERLVLVDPIVPPRTTPEIEAMIRAHANGSMADGARRRRAVWSSRDEARAKWAGKDLFARWDPRALDLYLAEGLLDRADGQVELACPPAVEAAIFEGGGAFDVRELAARVQVPALILWARAGNFPYTHFEELGALMKDARVHVADTGHLVPMEDPELVVAEVRRFAQVPVG
jgi:pimeloyl-ACP methyl ester carboxylesterase